MVRRSAWLDERAELLVRLLSERYDLQISDEGMDDVRADISDHLDYVTEMMRIGRQAAKVYVTDESIGKMAERIANEVNRLRCKQAYGPAKRSHLRVVQAWERSGT